MEWQPVRIAPRDGLIHATWRGPFLKSRDQCIGCIVRVQPGDDNDIYICGGQIFRIHPDDARNILGLTGVFGIAICCEHQIEAD